MRIAIIDLGTNSVRFDVQWIGAGNQVRLLHREKIMVRLGHGVFLRQRLDPSAKRRTVEALLSFRRTAARFKTIKTIAFGTSAVREAVDGESFVQQVQKRTGIEIRIISGEEEARLIALAILKHEQKPTGNFGLIDIGGGSTELNVCRDSTLLHSYSFQLGTARLQQVFMKLSPPTISKNTQIEVIQDLRSQIRRTLSTGTQERDWPQIPILIGSSGTVRALERILKRLHGSVGIDRIPLGTLVQRMTGLSRRDLLAVPGMEPKRVDMILAGAILLEELMDFLGANHVISTRYSLRDGILDREILLLSHGKGIDSRFQLDELYQKATQFGFPLTVLKAKVNTATELFQKTQNLHALEEDWLRYLLAGMILHEIGSAISPTRFEAHSYYIVRHADFLGMENWESEWIAQLCLKATDPRLTKKGLSFIKNKKERAIFLKLLALMRVAEALGPSKPASPSLKKVTIRSKKVKFTIHGRGPSELKVLRLNQRKTLFEEVFKSTLSIDTPAARSESSRN